MRNKLVPILVVIALISLSAWTFAPQNPSAEQSSVPGLPFTEDFTDTALRDEDETNANWSTDEEALVLNWRQTQYGVFDSGLTGSYISSDPQQTTAIALGDMDGDGDLDVVAGKPWLTNRLYLNNGTADPFSGVAGTDISSDAHETTSIALGDVDGDGDLDLAAGNEGQTNRLYLNNGTADPFSGVSGSDISSDANDTISIAVGDVDGDGDLDLVAGNEGQTNRLYLNNGTADPFSGVAGTNVSSDAHDTTSIALGDMDGDGDLDLLAGNYSETNRLYLNNGTAEPFSGVTGADVGSDAHRTKSIALGDMDSDGDLDLVAGNLTQTDRLYLNNGTASPFNGVTGSDISSDARYTRSVALGDVDGDGDLDLVVGNSTINRNRLYLNNGSANPFSGVDGTDISSDAHSFYAVVLGDMDGDGDLDLVAGNRSITFPNSLYLNNGTSNPFFGMDGSDISAAYYNTRSIALGDVDGDGDLDLALGNRDHTPTNRLYLNNGTADPFSGVSGSNISSDAHDTRSVELGDVDGDGDLDLVVGNNNQANRLYLNNGTADPFSGVAGTDISSDAHATMSIALGDVDGDGDLDLAAGNEGQTNRLYLNNGTADPFSGVSGSDISSDAHNSRSIALADVDGDGGLDLVAGNAYQTNRLYLNNGTADPFSGVTGADVSSDAHGALSVALGDVDGDGDLDLVAGNYNQTNRLYLNNGTADPFSGVAGADISSDAHETTSIALGDVDGDGDLDLLVGNVYQTNRLYLNDGTADPFSGVASADISSDVHDTLSIALGDVDGDGDLDLATGTFFAQPNRLYLNNCTASPFGGVSGSDISSDAQFSRSVALGDLDGDGDLDLVAGDYDQPNRLYLNNGTASPFSGVSGSNISSDAHRTYSISLGDVDGDGDLDLVAGNNSSIQPTRLYLNNGTPDPFSGVAGSNISSDAHDTSSIVLGDVDGDGDLDLVAGNSAQTNRLYLNDGTADPFGGVAGADISSDAHLTISIALADVDGDGDLDLVAGNYNQTNRLYLNNGTADPFSGVTGTDISSDAHETRSVALGDVDGDGDLDLVTGNDGQANRLYLNNGTADPFGGVTGADISSDAHDTTSIALADMDRDGDLDVLAGNWHNQINRLYLNNGTASPFSGVAGVDISSYGGDTYSISPADVDGDGDMDLVAGNRYQANRLYLQRTNYHTAHGLATSLRVDAESSNISNVTLTASADLPINTRVTYYLSNNGGARWYIVRSGVEFTFPSTGMDLRWKAELESLSPILTPRVNQIQIEVEDTYQIYLPLIMR
jgi:hypothetical protein